jgi:hypothetical protein
MRFTPILAASLPTLALAADAQIPLRDQAFAWFEKAKSFLPTPPDAAQAPVSAGAASVASHALSPLTASNWQTVLAPTAAHDAASGPETWMVLVSGGNKTCQGKCGPVEAAFNKSAALLTADPSAAAPHMALLDCDAQPVLCSTWMAGPPSMWYIQLPVYVEGEQSPAQTDVYVKHLNLTTTTAAEIVQWHRQAEWKNEKPVESMFHPFDGPLAKYGLQVPMGYVLYGFSLIPSWGMMLAVSFFTRGMMNKKAAPAAQGQRRAAPAAAARKNK